MSRPFIPLSSPSITGREETAVTAALREGRIASSESNLRGAREALQKLCAGRDVLLTTSCTTAMELALYSFDLKREDRVVVPSFTFVSTANAVLQAGGTPVFVDCEENTLNLDLGQVEALCGTPGVRGVMPVHYAGISCDMDRLMTMAKARGQFIVEDAAHAVGARYKDRPLGTLGDFGCFSFHDTKNFVSGEGGAIVINDPSKKDRIERMYEKGTNRKQFLRGEIDKYTWVSRGSSYPMSGVLAALLSAQLLRHDEIRAARKRHVEAYHEGLRRLVDEGRIRFTSMPSYAFPSYHLAFFLVADPTERDPFLSFLKERGIGATFHYVPLHLSPYAKEHLGTKEGQCPVTEKIAASMVRLPLFPQLRDDDRSYVIEQVLRFYHPELPVARTVSVPAAKVTEATLDFTLVVPCYNEEGHLHASLDVITDLLDHMDLQYEIILIDDCSGDATAERIRSYAAAHPDHRVRTVFHKKNKGRGATVTEGIRMAAGRVAGFLDIDLEVSAVYIPSALLPLMENRADMVLAERFYKIQLGAFSRGIMSKAYRWMVRSLLRVPAIDTEAGFKFFRRDAILPVLDSVRDPHWFWDTEVTVRAMDAGLRLSSLHVLFDRRDDKASTVRALRDSWRSLKALLAFRRERGHKPLIVPCPAKAIRPS